MEIMLDNIVNIADMSMIHTTIQIESIIRIKEREIQPINTDKAKNHYKET